MAELAPEGGGGGIEQAQAELIGSTSEKLRKERFKRLAAEDKAGRYATDLDKAERRIRGIAADRDAWKARAERAEARLASLGGVDR